MEGVRQVLLRVRDAKKEASAVTETPDEESAEIDLLSRRREPLRSGHPVAVNAIWKGLERWRTI
ncbi:hypothetical protein predicted by Glimmer/Critica [Acetobacter senegalensis]|uniref:Uncharacterized protein n=2 Tax=Acetobacter senegalensis TaxID=446692 RepID=A0A0U5EYD7_9PROT|nr:hypothetical protein predicted by Glimmer/Critica [Acetobacter senegalensis]